MILIRLSWIGFADEFKKDEAIDLRKDPMALQRLKSCWKKQKVELSSSSETEINLPYITAVDGCLNTSWRSWAVLNSKSLADNLFARCLKPCEAALKDAGYNISQIDEVILVGGSSRIPKCRNWLKNSLAEKPNRSVNPDEVVAVGACNTRCCAYRWSKKMCCCLMLLRLALVLRQWVALWQQQWLHQHNYSFEENWGVLYCQR